MRPSREENTFSPLSSSSRAEGERSLLFSLLIQTHLERREQPHKRRLPAQAHQHVPLREQVSDLSGSYEVGFRQRF